MAREGQSHTWKEVDSVAVLSLLGAHPPQSAALYPGLGQGEAGVIMVMGEGGGCGGCRLWSPI